MIDAIKERSTLKMETDLEDCADAFVSIAKNSSMTGQKIAVGKISRLPRVQEFADATRFGPLSTGHGELKQIGQTRSKS